MTLEELESLCTSLSEKVDELQKIDFKNITDFEQLPAIDFDDTLLVVTSADYTGRATVEQIMEYLNKNLRNFICWKPKVTDSTLSWERSSNDEAPDEIKFADIIFPMANETDNGMMTSADFIKLSKIKEDDIVYSDDLNTALDAYALKEHYHDQYQLKSDMPTKVSAFENDNAYITAEDIPTKVSTFENDSEYLTLDTLPIVSLNQSGLMTPDLLNILADISNNTVTNDELNEAIDNINNSFPTTVSSFENDANYMKCSQIYDTFGELGVINLIRNSEFQFTDSDTRTIAGWKIYGGLMECSTEDPDYPYIGKISFTEDTLLNALLLYSNSTISTISFIAKADTSAQFTISLGDGSNVVNVGTTWLKYSFTITDRGSNPSMYMQFKMTDGAVTENTLYITQVKVERGSLVSDFYPSYQDLKDMIKYPATLDTYGAVLPDGDTIGFDDYGKLRVLPKAINTLVIDDEDINDNTLYSSKKIENELAARAPLDDSGKVPAEYLPEYLDDVLEGVMTIDADGNYVFTVSDGQYGPAEPSKGIIYLDTESNIAWRWTGSTYTQCTTDKLGGAVLVKYNAADNYMYFVFPD